MIRARKEAGENSALPDHLKQLSAGARNEVEDVLHEVAQEELRPVVRDAITEDVLRAIQDLVGLTPKVVAAITEDLTGDDPTLRQRAYTLIAKYTLGHPAIVRPPEEATGQLVVNVGLPRPSDAGSGSAPAIEGTAAEISDDTRECDVCHTDKPVNEFVAGSNRCQQCHDEFQAAVRAKLDGEDDE